MTTNEKYITAIVPLTRIKKPDRMSHFQDPWYQVMFTPITLYLNVETGDLEILDGKKRYAAAIEAGLHTIRCLIVFGEKETLIKEFETK
jgi:hypothetical protein